MALQPAVAAAAGAGAAALGSGSAGAAAVGSGGAGAGAGAGSGGAAGAGAGGSLGTSFNRSGISHSTSNSGGPNAGMMLNTQHSQPIRPSGHIVVSSRYVIVCRTSNMLGS